MLIKGAPSRPSPALPKGPSVQARSAGALAELSAPSLPGEDGFPQAQQSQPQPGSCHHRDSCCFLHLSDNKIIYLAGFFGWFFSYILYVFSISLSPPPSADKNEGVRDSSYRGLSLLTQPCGKGRRVWLQARVTASPARGPETREMVRV